MALFPSHVSNVFWATILGKYTMLNLPKALYQFRKIIKANFWLRECKIPTEDFTAVRNSWIHVKKG